LTHSYGNGTIVLFTSCVEDHGGMECLKGMNFAFKFCKGSKCLWLGITEPEGGEMNIFCVTHGTDRESCKDYGFQKPYNPNGQHFKAAFPTNEMYAL